MRKRLSGACPFTGRECGPQPRHRPARVAAYRYAIELIGSLDERIDGIVPGQLIIELGFGHHPRSRDPRIALVVIFPALVGSKRDRTCACRHDGGKTTHFATARHSSL
jgi:hypothetical protein